MSSNPSKYGSSSGGGGDPFKNTTPDSMSEKLKEPKKKKEDSKRKEEHNLVSHETDSSKHLKYKCILRLTSTSEKENPEQKLSKSVSRASRTEAGRARVRGPASRSFESNFDDRLSGAKSRI